MFRVDSIVRGVIPGPGAPAVAVHELQIQRYFALNIGQRGGHGRKRTPSCQSACAVAQRIARSGLGQVGEQLVRALVADAESIDVKHGIAQSGPDEAVSDVMHVRKTINVNSTVHVGPCARDFSQAVGSERGKSENPTGDKYAGDVLKHRL